jgi:hypothetical protein
LWKICQAVGFIENLFHQAACSSRIIQSKQAQLSLVNSDLNRKYHFLGSAMAANASHKRRPDKGVQWRASGPEQP